MRPRQPTVNPSDFVPLGTTTIYVVQSCYHKPRSKNENEVWQDEDFAMTHAEAASMMQDFAEDELGLATSDLTSGRYFIDVSGMQEPEVLAAYRDARAKQKAAGRTKKPRKSEWPKFRVTCRTFNVTEEQVGLAVSPLA